MKHLELLLGVIVKFIGSLKRGVSFAEASDSSMIDLGTGGYCFRLSSFWIVDDPYQKKGSVSWGIVVKKVNEHLNEQ